VSGPGLLNLDLSLDKTFMLGERHALESMLPHGMHSIHPILVVQNNNVSNGDFGTTTKTTLHFPIARCSSVSSSCSDHEHGMGPI
jgi:hypothetical protein